VSHTLLRGFTNQAAVAIAHGAAVLNTSDAGEVEFLTRGKKLGRVRVRRLPGNPTPVFQVEIKVSEDGLGFTSVQTHMTAEWAMAHFVGLVGDKQATRAAELAAEHDGPHTIEATLRSFTYPRADEHPKTLGQPMRYGLGCHLAKTKAFGKWGYILRMSIDDMGTALGGGNNEGQDIDEALASYDAHVARKMREVA
jgi:hypothetical protein